MTPSEQTRVIYAQIQKLDSVRAEWMPEVANHHHRFRVAGEPTKRTPRT
jgi:hypothetical protein